MTKKDSNLSGASAEELIERLAKTQLFRNLDQNELVKIAAKIKTVYFEAGETVIRQDEKGDCLYIVINGRLRAFVKLGDEPQQIVGEVTSGESVGEMSVLTGEPRSATVKAIRDSELVMLSRNDFNEVVRRHPEIMKKITLVIIERLRETIHSPLQLVFRGKTVSAFTIIPLGADLPLENFGHSFARLLGKFGSTKFITKRSLPAEADANLTGSGINSEVIEWLNKQERRHSYLVYEADSDFTEWTELCVRHADCILLVGRANSESHRNKLKVITKDIEDCGLNIRTELVLLHHQETTRPANTGKWLSEAEIIRHHHLREENEQDYSRLIRILTGRGIGLVLGGGGARGFAHVGIIGALEEVKIPIDIIGGTSAGSYIAAQYAMGWSFEEMIALNKKTFAKAKRLLDYTFPMVSFITTRHFKKLLLEQFEDTRIEDLWIKYFAISSNLTHADLMIHEHGILWKSIRASGSLPGVAPPMLLDKNLLVDGGILDNLPVDIMKRMNSGGPVIAVDVSSKDQLEVDANYHDCLSGWQIMWRKLNPFTKPIEIPNILNILTRTSMLRSIHQEAVSKAAADIYIHPPLDKFSLLEFDSVDQIVDEGYRHGKKEAAKCAELLGGIM